MADPQLKLLNSLVTDPNSRQNFDLTNKNMSNIFAQLSSNNFSIGNICDSFTTNSKYPNLVNPTNLQVSITASGKRPIMVFLRQKSDAVTATTYTAGGVLIQNSNGNAGFAVFYISRGNLPIYGTVLGSQFGGFDTDDAHVLTMLHYISPSQILAFDDAPPSGKQTYFLTAAVYNTLLTSCTVNFTKVQLVAKELF